MHNLPFWQKRILKIEFVFAACPLLLCILGLGVQAQSPSEYQMKAGFLYNFAKFVEWPPEVSTAKDDPIRICIIGENPFGDLLNQSTEEKMINGRKVVIRQLKVGQDVKGCQIAFISSSEKSHLRTILENLKGAAVLTVGDSEGFAQFGGMINFILEENRVRFEVNVDAAKRAGLQISSKLLSLSKIVKEQGQGGKS